MTNLRLEVMVDTVGWSNDSFRVAGKRYKRLTIPGSGFPLSLSLCWNSLYVGDKSGGIHLVDTSQDRFVQRWVNKNATI